MAQTKHKSKRQHNRNFLRYNSSFLPLHYSLFNNLLIIKNMKKLIKLEALLNKAKGDNKYYK